MPHMPNVEIDDRLYLEAQTLFNDLEGQPPHRSGAGEALDRFLAAAMVGNPDDVADCQAALQALLGHDDGDYHPLASYPGGPGEALRRIVWTFHRAWVDRYGWRHSMPDRRDG